MPRNLLLIFGVTFSLCLTSCDETNAPQDSSTQEDADVDLETDATEDSSPPDSSTDADAGELEYLPSVTDHGVTWTFSQEVLVGRFITGDYYVVGPVTVVSVSPEPSNGRNGSVLNIPPDNMRSGFDERVVEGRYDASLRAEFPLDLTPGDSLTSSISVEEVGQVENWLREGNGEYTSSPVRSISILTCLDQAVASDTFRPSYADTNNRIYRLSQANRDLLPRLSSPVAIEPDYISMFAQRLVRPWVDVLFYAFDAQEEYMAMYGRECGRVAGIVSLLLMLELPPEQQELQNQLLIGFLQRGIDLWGLVRAGYYGWYAHGGHGNGRKWPIVFAGILFGDHDMASPNSAYPEIRFGEDMHTAFANDLPYGQAWNGATVVYTGHMGVWNSETVSSTPGWGPYEHLSPDEWIESLGEGYRRCCTSLSWVGQALAARLMEAQDEWNHDAFFAYVDRWMDPTGDDEYTQQIYEMTGWDYRASWQSHGQAWDQFVNEMWASYR